MAAAESRSDMAVPSQATALSPRPVSRRDTGSGRWRRGSSRARLTAVTPDMTVFQMDCQSCTADSTWPMRP